jgi:hypothetical protein
MTWTRSSDTLSTQQSPASTAWPSSPAGTLQQQVLLGPHVALQQTLGALRSGRPKLRLRQLLPWC